MPAEYLADSSVWMFSTRRGAVPAIEDRLDDLLAQDAIASCGPVELELLFGARNEHEFKRLSARLMGVSHAPTSESDWHEAALLGFRLRRIGVAAGRLDLLIATIAIRDKLVLLHADQDFERIAQHCDLKTESLLNLLP